MSDFKDFLRQLKEQADIVEVIGRTVNLRKAGSNYKGRCPFHDEKTPSFNVVPHRGIFHCFGCGAGGSVVDFVMRQERLEFIEAVEKLAKEMGLEMPRGNFQKPEQRDADQQVLRAVQAANDAALTWFRKNLLEKRNRLASDYLPERGITAELSEKFQLGAALDEWGALHDHLRRLGFEENTLVDAGLCARSDRGKVYDRFRNRLIFPIHDVNGKVCGFGGRQLVKEENSPKYYNSAETVLYKKSHMLYALNLARKAIERDGFAIFCEGYMDVIMAHAHGFEQAVASLGTALTPHQARLLKRYCKKTYFLYDGDAAGQKAMLRGGEPLLAAGFDTRVISLPVEDDPDTYLRREGPDALRARLDEADEFFDFAVRFQSEDLELSTLAGQAELVERLTPVIAAIQNDVMREGAIMRLLRRLGGLPREAVDQIIRRRLAENEKRESPRPARSDDDNGPSGAPAAPMLDAIERGLLKVMLESPQALELVRLRLQHEWVRDDRLARWIFFFNDHPGYLQTLLDEMEATGEYPAERSILNEILAWEHPIGEEPARAAEEILRRLHERYQAVLTSDLLRMIDNASTDPDTASRLLIALHNENRARMEHAGRHLRTKDYRTRRGG